MAQPVDLAQQIPGRELRRVRIDDGHAGDAVRVDRAADETTVFVSNTALWLAIAL